jgi:hypothetical protein
MSTDTTDSGLRAPGRRLSPACLLAAAALLALAASSCMAARLVIPNLADPSVVMGPDNSYYATGTSNDAAVLKIYRSPNLGLSKPFVEAETYNPSGFSDPYLYCWNWAAEISFHTGKPTLLFSAVRVNKGSACPGPDKLALFTAASNGLVNGKFSFGAPQPVSFPGVPDAPFPYFASGACPPQGCDRALRIDGNYFTDPNTGRTWLNYVWFENGCHLAGVDLANPGKIVHLADPTYSVNHGITDTVAEGSSVFVRDGRYYFLFSHNRFDQTYGTSYYQAGSFADFNSNSPRRQLSEAIVNRDGKILRNSGHGSVAGYGGQFYYLYHVGRFDANGRLSGRDTYLSPLTFDKDGRIKNIITVDIDWPAVPGAQYSLDIVTKSGEKISPCIGADIIGQKQNTVYQGYCPSSRDRVVDKSDIAQFRLCSAFNGDWAGATCGSKAYDGRDDAFGFASPSVKDEPRGVAVTEAVEPRQYSKSELESFFNSDALFNALKKPLQSISPRSVSPSYF